MHQMSQVEEAKIQDLLGLLEVMARLRHPEQGCPWDLKQTPESLRPHITEEAHELAEALGEGDSGKILDEMGDLLLQVVFLAQIFREKGQFDFFSVASHLCQKLIRRHTHIFGGEKASTPEEVKALWERQKRSDKSPSSVLSDTPPTLPALEATHRLSSQAAAVGFDWPDARMALAKVAEETSEVREALSSPHNQKALSHELGDLLMAVANVARLCGIHPETALREANTRFSCRFRHMERHLTQEGLDPSSCTPQTWEELWQNAKCNESTPLVDTAGKGRPQ